MKFKPCFAILLSVFLLSCKESTIEEKNKQLSDDKLCPLSMVVSQSKMKKTSSASKGFRSEVSLDYKGDALVSVSTKTSSRSVWGDDFYHYNSKGKLNKISTKRGDLHYHYSEGVLASIIEKSAFSQKRVFTYDKGGLDSETTLINAKVFEVRKYQYNDNGAPYKVTFVNANGVEFKEITVEFDDKKNPFVGKGKVLNIFESLLGYPIGNYKNNVKRLEIKYITNPDYTFSGEDLKAGDVEVSEFKYSYNKFGNPISRTFKLGKGEPSVFKMYYCNSPSSQFTDKSEKKKNENNKLNELSLKNSVKEKTQLNAANEVKESKVEVKPKKKLVKINELNIAGRYECHKYDGNGKNNWHYVQISKLSNGNFLWKNRAGVSWELIPTSSSYKFKVSKNNPYHKTYKEAYLTLSPDNQIIGIMGPHKEFYNFKSKLNDKEKVSAKSPNKPLRNIGCSQKKSRSLGSKTKVNLKFVNQSKKIKNVFWLNFKGKKKLYKKLNPRESYVQRTYLTHPWLVEEAVGGQCVLVVNPTKPNPEYTVFIK